MGGSVLDGFGGVVEFEEAVDEAAGEGVAAAYAVEDFELGAVGGFVELAVVPAEGSPVVYGGGVDFSEGCGGGFEVGEFLDGLFDHSFEVIDFDSLEVFIDAFDFEAEAGGEVFFIADHDIDVLGDFTIYFLGFGEATDAFPEGGAVIEIVGDYGAVFFGGFAGFDGEFSGGGGEGGEDASGVEPLGAAVSEDFFPVDVAGLHLGGGGVAAVDCSFCSADAEAALGEVEAVSDVLAEAIEVGAPLDEVGIDAALHDEVFDEVADFVFGEGGDDGGFEAEAFAEATGDVVFAAAFPGAELAGGADAAFTGIEAEHDFAEGDVGVVAFGGWSDF